MMQPDFKPTLFHPYYFIRKGLLGKLAQYAPNLSGKMMDFGCGSKPYQSFFNVIEYIGVDFENEGHPHDNEQIDVFYDGKNIPVENEYFDSVLSSEVFEHVFNLDEVLTEIHRTMKQNGKILITCPFMWKEHELPNDYARYTLFALKDLFKKKGFEIDIIDKSGNFVQVIFQLIVLYCYDTIYPKFNKVPFLKPVYRFFFIFLINILGIIVDFLLPKRKQMYFNNIVIAHKC